ncbi:hypothetical protein BGZ95_006838, partial [Linnemannia exigua]
MRAEPKRPRGSDKEFVDAVVRQYSHNFVDSDNPFLPDLNEISPFTIKYRIPTRCSVFVKGPELVRDTTGIYCDIDSSGPCTKALEYTQTQSFSTSRSITNSITVSVSAGFRAFSAGIEYSHSETNTVSHEWSNGKAFTETYEVPPGKSCALKIATYAYDCDFVESIVDLKYWPGRTKSEVLRWYEEYWPKNRAAKIPFADGTWYILRQDGNVADIYRCIDGGERCLGYYSGDSRYVRHIYGESNPINIDGAIP